MTLASGARLGVYEIIAPLGAGGMGEVYRGRDTRLNRTVAIKVLPLLFSGDAERKLRFEREARAISSLNHPHICSLYDIGSQDGADYLVMEFLEGETLAARLRKGPLTTELVIRFGIQVAEALDRAHRQGIIHRDLKPGNIMLTASGAKLLDFGLARYLDAREAEAGHSQSLTRDDPLTGKGVVLGTLQYMAPEQVEGKEADARTDIFSLGAVMYEMATGKRAFQGNSQPSLMAAILKEEPQPISRVQPLSPPALERLVKTCLAKDPDERLQSAHDVADDLKWISEGSSQALPPAAVARFKKRQQILTVSTILLFICLALAWAYFIRRPTAVDASILSMPVPGMTPPFWHSVSPDGRWLAFASVDETGQRAIWVRSFGLPAAERLADTDGATFLFWSPDSRFLGFFAQGKLKKIPVTGGTAQILCDAPEGRGGTWSKNGIILFAPTFAGGLYQVPEEGGSAKLVTRPDPARKSVSYRMPFFLPDGRHFLFVNLYDRPEENGIYVGSLESKENKRLLPDVSAVVYASGYLLFVRDQRVLMIQPLDAAHLRLSGEALPVSGGVQKSNSPASFQFSISDNVLTYQDASVRLTSQLTWFDRSGRQAGTLGPTAMYRVGRGLSPDEKRYLAERADTATAKGVLWMGELPDGNFTRFTFQPWSYNSAVWSPDGTHIAFSAVRDNTCDIYWKPSNGIGKEEPLFASTDWKFPYDWSLDGRYILYGDNDPNMRMDLWVLPLSGNRKPVPYLRTEFNERYAVFSPDARWVAYESDETGRTEVYVRPFPDAGAGKWQISTDGGSYPAWRRDGKELLYLSNDGKKMMAAAVTTDTAFQSGPPAVVFQTDGVMNNYSVTKDAQRFLVSIASAAQTPPPITVVLNWTALLKK